MGIGCRTARIALITIACWCATVARFVVIFLLTSKLIFKFCSDFSGLCYVTVSIFLFLENQDFFRRHSGGINLKECCDSTSRDPAHCTGGKMSSKNCQFHRYECCLAVGMQPVVLRAEIKQQPASPSAMPIPDLALPAVQAPVSHVLPSCEQQSLPPSSSQQSLPDWAHAINIFNAPDLRWKAFCTSLSINSSAFQPSTSIEQFLAQTSEYSDLLMRYSGEEASVIWHERGSLRLCLESFFSVSKDIASPTGAIATSVPLCVHVDYVAQKQVREFRCFNFVFTYCSLLRQFSVV